MKWGRDQQTKYIPGKVIKVNKIRRYSSVIVSYIKNKKIYLYAQPRQIHVHVRIFINMTNKTNLIHSDTFILIYIRHLLTVVYS